MPPVPRAVYATMGGGGEGSCSCLLAPGLRLASRVRAQHVGANCSDRHGVLQGRKEPVNVHPRPYSRRLWRGYLLGSLPRRLAQLPEPEGREARHGHRVHGPLARQPAWQCARHGERMRGELSASVRCKCHGVTRGVRWRAWPCFATGDGHGTAVRGQQTRAGVRVLSVGRALGGATVASSTTATTSAAADGTSIMACAFVHELPPSSMTMATCQDTPL